jgi:hypothetical protein
VNLDNVDFIVNTSQSKGKNVTVFMRLHAMSWRRKGERGSSSKYFEIRQWKDVSAQLQTLAQKTKIKPPVPDKQ